jgi:hypothetical protein
MAGRLTTLGKRTYQTFSENNAGSRGAAIAFYTVTSIAPILLIVIAMNWELKVEGTLSLVFVKYETLHDHLPDIAAALGVHFRRFPPHRPRKSHPPEDVPERLLALRTQFDALPRFFVRN